MARRALRMAVIVAGAAMFAAASMPASAQDRGTIVYLVPTLLDEFQTTRVHMAIVIDEYGGVSGLVTIEDLLEEIVGEIRDEFDVGETEIQRVADSEFMIDARLGIDDFKDNTRRYWDRLQEIPSYQRIADV